MSQRNRARGGFTLLELMIVVTIMGVLIAVPAPMFGRAMEQPKLDVAASNLRSIWAAERLYYLENGKYGALPDPSNPLASDTLPADLIDPTIVSGSGFYSYSVVGSPDGKWKSFTASATRQGSSTCSGTITITESGKLDYSTLSYAGQPMTPSLEPKP